MMSDDEAVRHMLEFLGWCITGDHELDPNVRASIERWAADDQNQ